MAEANEMYLVTSRRCDCTLRAREEEDSDEIGERREVSSVRSGVRVVAIVQAGGRTVLENGLYPD
jgi:hypothetical protein